VRGSVPCGGGGYGGGGGHGNIMQERGRMRDV
jgi:hypothetical protein